MQFEDFDNKIRQAAEQHHPNYDETAWTKMEKLLDRHLPTDSDRRRRTIFFLLFFLFLGGGILMLVKKPWQQNKIAINEVNETKSTGQNLTSRSTSTPAENIIEKSKQIIPSVDGEKDNVLITEPIANDPVSSASNNKKIISLKTGSARQNKDQSVIHDKKKPNGKLYELAALPGSNVKNDLQVSDISTKGINRPEIIPAEANLVNSSAANNKKASGKIDSNTQTTAPLLNKAGRDTISATKTDLEIAEQLAGATDKKTTKKSKSKKTNSFFFSLSAGPDVSFIGMKNPGEMKLLTGAGFGYSFREKWILRTGFYSVSKIYSAKPEDYKPSNPVNNPTYLSKVNADCKVYEIPVSLAYNFIRSGKNMAFASVGLSSYIMKKEAYNYVYKYPGSPNSVTHSYTFNNENKHYFSVLILSGGYQRKINETFGFMIEPYFKLPLAGVGRGNVKLNSAGVLVSVNVSLFNTGSKK